MAAETRVMSVEMARHAQSAYILEVKAIGLRITLDVIVGKEMSRTTPRFPA